MSLKSIILGLLGISIAIAGWIALQESDYGSGPRASHDEISGEAREMVFVANALDGSVTVIDLASQSVVATIDVAPDGKRVGPLRDLLQSVAQPIVESRAGLNFAQDTDISRDGTVMFVSRGYLGDVVALSLENGEALWRTPVAGIRADHMAISPDGRRLAVAATIMGGDVVQLIDTANGEVIREVQTGTWPHDVTFSADGSRLFIASLGDMQTDLSTRDADPRAYLVTVASLTDETVDPREYRFEAGVRPFQLSPDETMLFAQLSNTHAIVAHDLAVDMQRARIDLPIADGVTVDDWDFEAPHHGLAITPDGSLLCVAGRASDYAALVSTEGLTLQRTIAVGNAPSWSAIDTAGEFCVLANTRSDDVSIVSLVSGEEIVRIAAGDGPKHVTIAAVAPEIWRSWID
ncbi:beta-propeller fold lactonase family protein [Aurantiacibacter sediminis]|uniref:YncE family protein n=1 Tax=Aurantiacibacter sediminis TaxID=2793064 RepID=A0ABS0N3B9_9SPHN|nr:hypothetical protein [Aurantiacibacter sediminis]MBH5322468.1 hypothetical protein [Aurantiacibacter sediminis]